MKRTIAAWIAIIVLVAVAGTAYVFWQNSIAAHEQNKAAERAADSRKNVQPTPASDELAQQAAEQPGVYEEYQEGLVASTDGVRLLFFHAPWCPQCRMIEADIQRQGVPNGVSILKVDYDSNQALRQKYGVTLQTTFVEIDDRGGLVEKYVAYNEPTFDSVKSNLLSE